MEWRRLPHDPRSPLAWWWSETKNPLLASALVLGLFGTNLVVAMLHGWYAMAVVHGAFAFSICWGAISNHRKRALPSLTALAPSPSPTETFPVEFSIFQGKLCTGRDQGVASVVDGWLHVEGLRTSFSLRPIDTVRVGVAPGGADVFDLPGGQRIEVRPLGTAADRATFGETIRVWHRFTFGSPTGEPTLPPLEVHASAVVRPLTMIFLGVATVLGMLALVPLLLAQGTQSVWVIFPGALYFVFRDCGQAVGTIRKLAALGKESPLSEGTRSGIRQ